MSTRLPPRIPAIGEVHSCFPDKFGVPRQPSLCPHATGRIVMDPPWNDPDAFRGIEDFSHLWITFLFHQVPEDRAPSALVRPPRLGGNQRMGVFASRSPFRPGRLGLSLVRNQGVTHHDGRLCLNISELDLVDGTPVLDIKPFLPWCDAPEAATGAWANEPPAAPLSVSFSADAQDRLQALAGQYPNLPELVHEVLSQDPRPAYHDDDPGRRYALRLHNLDIHWVVTQGECFVVTLSDT